ncbi:hypothetical protein NGTWS0302_24930 [Mycolicibacterium cyprinidarum]|uniref:GGDEF domain-containing protein n=1 Tax=Mycolicibacterium cyprinidarum TaxID=2860311 RepID=A0ABQ4VEL8_9MYCO|nr:hypothetical protein NGTWS0302_24930 [Mycolicibacterium sp. NGTWS0302]GJF17422.1 hypothetical protein NGTWS1702_23820 [Mycolicibacterium sp. NGTWSNA01]GJF18487.1 hypothetical protein NGTWS1803_07690 [Mycolicibacterium sp. NGTWS1803]
MAAQDAAAHATRRPHLQSLLHSWWTDPGDYEWLLKFLSNRSLLPGLRATICLSGVTVGMAAFSMQFIALPEPVAVSRAVAAILALASLLWVLYWWFGAWPSPRMSAVLFLLVDLGIVTATALHSDPLQAIATTPLFAVPGAYIVFFHGPRLHAAHLLIATATITAAAVWLATSPPAGSLALALSRALIALAVTVGILPALQFFFWMIRHSSVESLADPLTELANRRGLDNHLTRMASDTSIESVVVIVIDLDGFKLINDRFGHHTGDEVLVRTSERILQTVRRSAFVARTGGEEFVVIDRAPTDTALATGERIRLAIAAPAHPTITASIGLAVTERGSGTTFADALVAADAAMYAAKHDGGNRIAISQGHPA